MKQYYLITGCNNGDPIDPYVINDQDNDLDAHLAESGDMARYYEPITAERAAEIEKARKAALIRERARHLKVTQ